MLCGPESLIDATSKVCESARLALIVSRLVNLRTRIARLVCRRSQKDVRPTSRAPSPNTRSHHGLFPKEPLGEISKALPPLRRLRRQLRPDRLHLLPCRRCPLPSIRRFIDQLLQILRKLRPDSRA